MSTIPETPFVDKIYYYPCNQCKGTEACIGHTKEQINLINYSQIFQASADKFVFKRQVLAEIKHWAINESYRNQKKVDLLNSLAETIEKEEWTHE